MFFRSAVGRLEADGVVSIPLTHGKAMQGELFRQLRLLDSAGASLLHGGGPDRRHYTVSQISGPFDVERGLAWARPGAPYWFRLTGIGAVAVAALSAVTEKVRDWNCAGAQFRIAGWETQAGSGESWGGSLDMGQLLEAAVHDHAAEPNRIVLGFLSPATMKRNSESRWARCNPIPVPEQVFASISERASLVSPDFPRPPDWRALLTECLAVGQYELQTRSLDFGRDGGKRVGFVGTCEFLIDPALGPSERLWLHLLGGLAFYTGVGAETSWGMGQARREPAERFRYRGW
ncbi:MAG: CRISPR system precrRNA processing endoribonuclease RAMP protein Cas6 [Bryobacterales bacterium]|nr:CRISPR system precrRNA processing endoribonuclease RAMP protein Cas6 [Bryobacterales bacterium]